MNSRLFSRLQTIAAFLAILMLHGLARQGFAQQPGSAVTGRILTPDGKPAVGVNVVIAGPKETVFIAESGPGMSFAPAPQRFVAALSGGNTAVMRGKPATGSVTDKEGRFDLPLPAGKYFLIAYGDAGFAQADQAALAQSSDLQLQPWGMIEGTLFIRGKPAAGERVGATRPGWANDPEGPQVSFNAQTRTDAQGQFQFDRVLPGEVSYSRSVPVPKTNASMLEWLGGAHVLSGQTTTVALGQLSRPVIGRIILPPESSNWENYTVIVGLMIRMAAPPLPPEIQSQPPQAQQDWRNAYWRTAAGIKVREHRYDYNAKVDSDGSFRIDDVMPGTYVVRGIASPHVGGANLAIGQAAFEVPPLDGDDVNQPLVIPDLPIRKEP